MSMLRGWVCISQRPSNRKLQEVFSSGALCLENTLLFSKTCPCEKYPCCEDKKESLVQGVNT